MPAERMIEQTWFTVREVAERLGVDVRTVRTWVKGQELPALYVGGRSGYRISDQAIEDFLQRRQVRELALRELSSDTAR